MSHELLITRFSMYIFLKDAPGSKKVILVQQSNPTLKNIIIALVQDNPNVTEDRWARYFLENLIEIPDIYQFLWFNTRLSSVIEILSISLTCSYHLIFSYLQLICFYAAKQISDRFQNSSTLKVNYPLEECFLIACEASLKPAKLLKNFNFKANFPVHGYARIALDRVIQNQIVKEQKNRAIKFSDNGLLKQLNATQLEKALKEYGISHQEIIKYRLAWQAFKDSFNEIYTPTDSKGTRTNLSISILNDRQLNLIAQRFAQLGDRLKLKNLKSDGKEIQKLLNTCIQVSRNFQNRQFISLEDRWNITDSNSNFLEIIIEQETQQELVELKNIIVNAFEALDNLSKKYLLLWLGLGINQNDFLTLFNFTKQYQVARQFQRYQKKILIDVLRFYYQQNLSQILTEKELDLMCCDRLEFLKSYLSQYSHNYFVSILNKLFQKKQIDRFNVETINAEFTQIIEQNLNIKLQQFPSAQPNIKKFIEKWLQQNQAILSK